MVLHVYLVLKDGTIMTGIVTDSNQNNGIETHSIGITEKY